MGLELKELVKVMNEKLGTTAGVNFIGTTDSQPLEFKVNSQLRCGWSRVAATV